MHSRIVPIFSENTVILFIEIQLIHSEGNQKILGLTLFFIGILIFHSHLPHNPRSGGVMRQVGMKYQYSYEEKWQPKDFLVTFRMYQLNFNEKDHGVFKKYWDNSAVHFIEAGI